MKDRPVVFIAACIILSVCMTAFLQCSSSHTFVEGQDELKVNNNTQDMEKNEQFFAL